MTAELLSAVPHCAGETPYPAFLSQYWFQHENASALRKHIRNLILQLFREQKRLPDDHQTVVNAVADMADYQENKSESKYGLLLQQSQVALQLYFDISCHHGKHCCTTAWQAPGISKSSELFLRLGTQSHVIVAAGIAAQLTIWKKPELQTPSEQRCAFHFMQT